MAPTLAIGKAFELAVFDSSAFEMTLEVFYSILCLHILTLGVKCKTISVITFVTERRGL